MADLPLEGRKKQVVDEKEVPLTVEERLDRAEADIKEIARGVNVQGALLQGIVNSFDAVIKTYLMLIGKYVPPTVAKEKGKDA